MESAAYGDIIILALIAGFILLRLRSVLGQKTGHEKPKFFKRDTELGPSEDDKVVHISDKALKARPADEVDTYLYGLENAAVKSTLSDIKKLDSQFVATDFLAGAKMAYEMVFDAFGKGDKKTLEMLLEKSLYDTFAEEIDARKTSEHITETTLVSVKARDIISAQLTGNTARLAVKFDSEQVSLTKDKHGAIIGGSASETHLIDDEWLFERDVTSKNPNWKIIET